MPPRPPRKSKKPLPPDFDDIVRHLFIRLRWSVPKIAVHLKVSNARVYAFLKAIGYKTRGRDSFISRGVYYRRHKLTPAQFEALKTDLRTNALLTHSALARKYDLSRERIRQISVDIGAPPRAKILAARRVAEAAAQQARTAQLREAREATRFQQVQDMRTYWNEGLEVAEIAKRMGLMTSTVGVRIVKLRRQYPEWFPFRNIPSYLKHADFYAELDAKAAAAEAKKAEKVTSEETPVLPGTVAAG